MKRWKKPISKFRRAKLLRWRAQWLRFGQGDKIVLRWHGGSISELEAAWHYGRKRHMPFVPGFYMQPRLRQRHVMNLLMKKAA